MGIAVEHPGSDVIASIGQVKVVFRNKKRIRRLQFRLVFEGNSSKRIGCKVKEALQEGHISKLRYDNYIQLFDEIKSRRKW